MDDKNALELLKYYTDNGILNKTAVEKRLKDMKREKIKQTVVDRLKSVPKIYRHNDGKRIFTKIKIFGKWKQICAKDEDELYQKIYDTLCGDDYITLAKLFPRFMLYRRDMNKVSVKTMQENKLDWDKYIKDSKIADIPMRDLKPKHFISLFEEITKDGKLTSKKVCNIKSLLNKMYAYAIREEMVDYNPIKSIDFSEFKYYVPDNSDKVYSLENRQKLLNYLHDMEEVYALSIQLDFQLTCRVGELKALRWEDVDFNNRRISINKQALDCHEMNDDLTFTPRTVEVVSRIKGNTSKGKRELPMTTEAERILRIAKKINPNGEYVFMPFGRLMLTDTFNEYLKKYCEQCGVPYLSSHKIRFCSCSTLYNGKNLTQVSRLMGHSQTATTLHYLRNVNSGSDMLEEMETAFAVSAPNRTK